MWLWQCVFHRKKISYKYWIRAIFLVSFFTFLARPGTKWAQSLKLKCINSVAWVLCAVSNGDKNSTGMNRHVDVRRISANLACVSNESCITCRHYLILHKKGEHRYHTRFEVLTAMLSTVSSNGMWRLINWYRVEGLRGSLLSPSWR
jgi:hypothetical protein